MNKHESAFPRQAAEPGMSLRDWFAGQSLLAIIQDQRGVWSNEEVAAQTYMLADALLAQRSK